MAGVEKRRVRAARKASPDIKRMDSTSLFGLEFDGASKGNPGKAGAGAILRSPDGSVLCELTKGIGIATCNAAEYCALIIGLQAALNQGILHLRAQGDSQLVCKQVMGKWKVRSKNLADSFAEVMNLVKRFQDFSIHHVRRKFNSAADALANTATELPVDKLVCSYRTSPGILLPLKVIKPDGSAEELISEITLANGQEISSGRVIEENKLCQQASLKNENERSYRLEYDGSCKGNPGKAGVGVLLRRSDGSVHLELREGLGMTTRNVAHYWALVIGLRIALDQGISCISVQGDSSLVFKQMVGKCKVNDENLQSLWKEANDLRRNFREFSISNVDKEHNAAARALAEAAIQLPEAYSNKFMFPTGNGMPSKHGKSTQGLESTKLDLCGGTQSMDSLTAVSKAVVLNCFSQVHSSGKVLPWSLYSNQGRGIHGVNTPQAMSFSVAMSKCTGLSSFLVTKSSARIVCRVLVQPRHLSSIFQKTVFPATGAMSRIL